MIIEIEAKFSCDDCGTEFFAPLDPAYDVPSGWSVMAVAEDAVRGGIGYSDGTERPYNGSGSVGYDGRHYCARCTRKYDKLDDADDPRIRQIQTAEQLQATLAELNDRIRRLNEEIAIGEALKASVTLSPPTGAEGSG